MHVHPERGGLQATQVDDAILGAPDFDIVHGEEPVTVGIRLEKGGGLWVASQAEPRGLPKDRLPSSHALVCFHQVRVLAHEQVRNDLTCPYLV